MEAAHVVARATGAGRVDLATEPTNERAKALREALAHISEGRNPLLYATLGPDDPIIKKTVDRVRELGETHGMR